MNATARPTTKSTHIELVLNVLCHDWLVAMDANAIERVAMTDEARLELNAALPSSGQTTPSAYLGLLNLEGRQFAAWDLGLLVDRTEEAGSWVFLNHQRHGGEIALALRAGPCRTVGTLPAQLTSALPPCLGKHGRRPFRAAFRPTSMQLGRSKGVHGGLVMDFARLWTPEELAFARNQIDLSRRQSGRRR